MKHGNCGHGAQKPTLVNKTLNAIETTHPARRYRHCRTAVVNEIWICVNGSSAASDGRVVSGTVNASIHRVMPDDRRTARGPTSCDRGTDLGTWIWSGIGTRDPYRNPARMRPYRKWKMCHHPRCRPTGLMAGRVARWATAHRYRTIHGARASRARVVAVAAARLQLL